MATPLFDSNASDSAGYSAEDIEVLEGLEPVRKRPGMYIGGTDERALHHLVTEVIDNSMDEAVAGHANRIEVTLNGDGSVKISDNGRGIPVDPHPKFPKKSALEVILTTLHAGGKFSGKAYQTSGGLHGVGVSVVNALSDHLDVEVARDKQVYGQTFSRGLPTSKLEKRGKTPNRRGTTVTFSPDPEIFGPRAAFKPARLLRMARSKAYLFQGVEIRWKCDPALLKEGDETPPEATFHFPNGLADFLPPRWRVKRRCHRNPLRAVRSFPRSSRIRWARSNGPCIGPSSETARRLPTVTRSRPRWAARTRPVCGMR